ncbi:hypothetical protein CLD22_06060 [Rubrivivax gelatinosus]|nr:hypothetical protein [Rubrivivax gelatinosus]
MRAGVGGCSPGQVGTDLAFGEPLRLGRGAGWPNSGGRVFGILSPLEQSRRHEGPLHKLFKHLQIIRDSTPLITVFSRASFAYMRYSGVFAACKSSISSIRWSICRST